MPQTTILASGQTAAQSSTVTITSGGSATLSMVVPPGKTIPRNISLAVLMVVGTSTAPVASLNFLNPVVPLGVPGVFRVDRSDISAYGVDVAVTSDA